MRAATSDIGRFCCKSRKSNDPKNLAKVELWTSPLLLRFSMTLPRSKIDFGRNDMVPHVAARKTRQRLLESSFDTPKRLLQQYLPIPDSKRNRLPATFALRRLFGHPG